MRAIAQINKPDEVDVTITITAPLKEWKALREQIGGWEAKWPAYDFQRAIVEVVNKLATSALSTPTDD